MDEFEELTSNIKSMLERQDKLEKSDDEIKKDIHDMKSLGGRMRKTVSGSQSGLIDSIETAILENKDMIQNFKNIHNVAFSTKAPQDMTFSSVASTASATVSQVDPFISRIPPRPTHIQEVFTIRPLSTAYAAYLKESSTDGNVSMVRAGSIKPQLSTNFTEVQAKAQVVAGWMRVSTAMLDDIADLSSFISYRLSENLLSKLDQQIINGDGNDPNLSGILLAANHSIKTGTATIFSQKIIQGIGQLASYGRRASAILVNPVDYFNMLIETGVTSGDYTSPFVFQTTSTGQITILGIPLIWNSEITSGNYLIGDFTFGANLYQRQAPTIQIFYQDSDNVQKNFATIRCEARYALTVLNAQAFIYPT